MVSAQGWVRYGSAFSFAMVCALLPACEGALTLATGGGQDTPSPPMITVPTDGGAQDAGLLRSDASYPGPDAYVPPTCVPYCAGRQCGADGCGATCGVCASGTACNAAAQCEALPPVEGEPGTTHTVTLYGTTWCGYCQEAKRFFNANDIEFADRDLDEPGVSDEAYEHVYELTGRYSVSTPTVIIDDDVIFGWSEQQVRGLLDL